MKYVKKFLITSAYILSFLAVVLICIGMYAATIRSIKGNVGVVQGSKLVQPTNIFESSHDRAPYALVLSLDRDKKFDLSKDLADFGSPDVGVYKKKFYILFPPGASLLAYPFFELGKQYGLAHLFSVSAVALLGFLSIILIFLICKDVFALPFSESLIAGIVYAFGTTSWGYATTIYQHVPTTFLLLLGFYSAWHYKQKGFFTFVWGAIVWTCYGMGIFLDLPNVLLLAPIMVYFFLSSFYLVEKKEAFTLSWRVSFLITSFCFAVLIGAHANYNKVAFGDWKTFGQSLDRFEGDVKYQQKLDLKAKEATLSAELKPKKTNTSILKEEHITNGLYELTVANDKGIFFFSPVLLLGIFGLWLVRKNWKLEHTILVAVILANVFIYSSFSDVWGGWAYGPRYLIPTMSLLAIAVGIFLAKLRRGWLGRPIFLGLFGFSAAIGLLGVLTTNTVPPIVEAIPMGLKYNYTYAWDFYMQGQTSSFVYTNWFAQHISLQQYATWIFTILVSLVALLTLLPAFIRWIQSWRKYED